MFVVLLLRQVGVSLMIVLVGWVGSCRLICFVWFGIVVCFAGAGLLLRGYGAA